MHVAKDDVDVKMEIPGAVIRQRLNFGDVRGFDTISGEYFTLSAGVDTTPSSRAWKAISVSAPIGASCCAANSPRPMRTARGRRST